MTNSNSHLIWQKEIKICLANMTHKLSGKTQRQECSFLRHGVVSVALYPTVIIFFLFDLNYKTGRSPGFPMLYSKQVVKTVV